MCGLALLGAFVIAGGAAAAVPADRIAIAVPGNVTPTVTYGMTIQGFAYKRAIAYLFVDYAGCARSFAAEHNRASSEARFYSVHGSFSVRSWWNSSSKGMDHACAYLLARHTGKLLAKARVSFQIR